MKTWSVTLHVTKVAAFTIKAKTPEEAEEKAKEIALRRDGVVDVEIEDTREIARVHE